MQTLENVFKRILSAMKSTIPAFVFGCSTLAQAQNDSWISQAITPIGSNEYYYACADECCAFVCDNQASIYYFDIKSSQWAEYQVPNNEQPNQLGAADYVFVAIGDSSLIGYSSISQQLNFRRFEGNPVDFYYNGQLQSYACYGKFAAFLTDENLYVFDAEHGSWKVRNYSLPPNFYPNGQLYIKDDYVLVIFNNSVNARPINIVYNLLQHDFHYISESVNILEPMDHGFAGRYEISYENYWIGGYSVYTNNFVSSLISNQGYFEDGGPYRDSKVIGEFTVYCIQFRKAMTPPDTRINLYAFDTEEGNWINWNSTFSGTSPSPPLFGGKLSVSWWQSNNILGCVVFNGVTNSFYTLSPNLIWNYNAFLCGGRVFTGQDSVTLWGYDINNQRQSSTASPFYIFSNLATAENFSSVCRLDYFQDIMSIYFYNGQNNSWETVQTWKATSDYYKTSRNVYNLTVMNPGFTESQITFYSPLLDSIVQITQPGMTSTTAANDFLAYTAYSNKSYFFNSWNARVDEFDFNFGSPGLTDTAAFFLNQGTNTLYGYSSISRNWTSFTPSQAINQREIRRLIGIAASAYQARVYAYNSFKDRFTELSPASTPKSLSVGGKTALLVRNDIVYAYDPDVTTEVVQIDSSPINYHLFQNYPNPLNPNTTISWQSPVGGLQTLKVYDILGNEVETLVDEYRPAGEYEIDFNGRGLSSGVYFYQLIAGSFVGTKKMILIK